MTLTIASSAGAASIGSRPPNRISVIRIESRAFAPDVTEPKYGLSEMVCSAKVMSRWRESSGRSPGSQITPPGESICGNACESFTSRSKSSSDAVVLRLIRMRSVRNFRSRNMIGLVP